CLAASLSTPSIAITRRRPSCGGQSSSCAKECRGRACCRCPFKVANGPFYSKKTFGVIKQSTKLSHYYQYALVSRLERKPKLEEKMVIELLLNERNEESCGVLFEYVYPKVYRFFVLRSLEPLIAEELSQNVLLAVYRGASKLQNDRPFLGWLFKVAR